MELPTTTIFLGDLASSQKEQKQIVLRAAHCSADNCYRALFPCPSPWVVTEAVRYCATVSAGSATNYPTQAIAACGTGKERYISACSCPATNCPVGTTSQTTTPLETEPLVITTTVEDKGASENDPTPIIASHQISSTAIGGGAVPVQTLNDGTSRSDKKSSTRPVSEVMVAEPSVTDSISPDYPKDSSADSQAVDEGKSVTTSQSPSSPSDSLFPQPLATPLGQSSIPASSLPSIIFPETTSAKPTGSLGTRPPKTTSPPGLTVPSTPGDGPDGLSAGLVAAIAVGSALAALLLIGAAGYCCLKRHKARRRAWLPALTLSQGCILDTKPDAWKPPVELPHPTTAARRVELEDSVTLCAQLDDTSSLPVTSSSLSADSPREMQGTPPPAELLVLPAELPSVYKI